MTLGPAGLLEAFERMLVIRLTEERLIHLRDDLRAFAGAYQVYVGQEATAVGTCSVLQDEDYVFTTHRNHGHVLARGGDPGALIAEMLGRQTGLSGGRSGTMHMIVPERGVLHTSAMVGGNLPLATGAAFSAKHQGTSRVVVAFIGDAVLEEGAFYESLNMASLWRLPLVIVCENNSIPWGERRRGQHPSSTHAAADFCEVAKSFSVATDAVDGADVGAVAAAAGKSIQAAREGAGPSFLQAHTSRWPGNYPARPTIVGGDTEVRWAWDAEAVPEELAGWSPLRDPILRLAVRLTEEGLATRARLVEIERACRQRIAEAAEAALAAPLPDPATARHSVYAPVIP